MVRDAASANKDRARASYTHLYIYILDTGRGWAGALGSPHAPYLHICSPTHRSSGGTRRGSLGRGVGMEEGVGLGPTPREYLLALEP